MTITIKLKIIELRKKENPEVNVENVIQNMSELDKIISKMKNLLYHGNRGNALSEHMKNEIYLGERF